MSDTEQPMRPEGSHDVAPAAEMAPPTVSRPVNLGPTTLRPTTLRPATLRPATLRRVLLEYAAIFAVAVALLRLPVLRGLADWIFPAFMFGAALFLADRSGRPLKEFGLDLGGLLDRSEPLSRVIIPALRAGIQESGFALLAAGVLFPPYAAVILWWRSPEGLAPFSVDWTWATFFLMHLVAVALPEEALFRGYFHSRLRERFVPRHRVMGAVVAIPALVGQALLFALFHLADGSLPSRVVVFFPALLFGWLRAKRGGIGAAVVCHALANLLGAVLAGGP